MNKISKKEAKKCLDRIFINNTYESNVSNFQPSFEYRVLPEHIVEANDEIVKFVEILDGKLVKDIIGFIPDIFYDQSRFYDKKFESLIIKLVNQSRFNSPSIKFVDRNYYFNFELRDILVTTVNGKDIAETFNKLAEISHEKKDRS